MQNRHNYHLSLQMTNAFFYTGIIAARCVAAAKLKCM